MDKRARAKEIFKEQVTKDPKFIDKLQDVLDWESRWRPAFLCSKCNTKTYMRTNKCYPAICDRCWLLHHDTVKYETQEESTERYIQERMKEYMEQYDSNNKTF